MKLQFCLHSGRCVCVSAVSAAVRPQRAQGGFALITSLLIIVIVSMLAVSMYRGSGLLEKVAGNTLEKQRSLQAAQSALQYGEWWLASGAAGIGTGATCSGTVQVNNPANMRVCTQVFLPADALDLPWSVRSEYTPPNMTVLAGGGLNGSTTTGITGDVNYAAAPSLHVAYLGLGAGGSARLYQVTGVGWGGNASTASVVQSTYALTSSSTSLTVP